MNVREVMTRDVVSVAPGTPLKEVAAILVERGVSGLPVCDPEGRVLGVVSEADILFKERGPTERRRGALAWLADGEDAAALAKTTARTAGEAMTAPAITIAPSRTVSGAARLMLEHGVNRLPVVKGGALAGIVTRADLVRAFRRTDAEIAREVRTDVIEHMLWLPPTDIAVDVDDGEVTLSGRVESRLDAQLLPKLVARVPGVVGVRADVSWRVDDTGRRGTRVPAGRP
jgi:CBS domain-containing protein